MSILDRCRLDLVVAFGVVLLEAANVAHGSSRQSPAFLASTRPELAVVSVGAGNDYGHPTAKTLRLVQGLGPAIARTDTDGAVAVSRAKGRLWVTTQR